MALVSIGSYEAFRICEGICFSNRGFWSLKTWLGHTVQTILSGKTHWCSCWSESRVASSLVLLMVQPALLPGHTDSPALAPATHFTLKINRKQAGAVLPIMLEINPLLPWY